MDAANMKERDTRARIIAGFVENYWSDATPSWSRDPFNGNMPAQCGECGAWLELVRPGKHQCGACQWIDNTPPEEKD